MCKRGQKQYYIDKRESRKCKKGENKQEKGESIGISEKGQKTKQSLKRE
jgi:hypothetical protein